MSRPGGCEVLAGSEIESCLEAFLSRLDGCKVWVWVWLEASSFLQMEPWLDASNPEQVDLSRPDACKFGLGRACFFLFLRDKALAGGREGLNHGGLFRGGCRVLDLGLARGL